MEIKLKDNIFSKHRTNLANERTLLAYIRTSLAFLVLGAFIIKFLENGYKYQFGIFTMLIGIIILVIGFVRFKKCQKEISGV